MEIEEIPKSMASLQKQIEILQRALLMAGICPRCGNKIEEQKEHTFTCPCGLTYILSQKAINNIKQGKDITAT
jgi:DNA-directed RNA polymerase subunit RPC12/RpoP